MSIFIEGVDTIIKTNKRNTGCTKQVFFKKWKKKREEKKESRHGVLMYKENDEIIQIIGE